MIPVTVYYSTNPGGCQRAELPSGQSYSYSSHAPFNQIVLDISYK